MTVTDGLLPGSVLAGYRVESVLGRGGMSIVYLAEDLRLRRKVALKVMSPELADDEAFRVRFLAESQLAASIDHPNIVPIYAAGEDRGQLYIAMRYVPSGDLRASLRRRPLDPDEAVGILAQVAGALDAAHARGLVHRDVKPSNVLLDAGSGLDGAEHAYLADFGLTKRTRDRSRASQAGGLVGTIDYVAPEQIAGGRVDGRADVYALGCVLYECLTGSPPFPHGTDIEVVFAHLESEPPSAAAQRPGLPAGLDPVIARAMAKDPDDRYPNCRELARAASAVLVDEAARLLADVASRAVAGRDELTGTEAELVERVMALQAALSRGRALSGMPPVLGVMVPGRCPFKGLASFGAGDAEYFFGRERLVAELATRLVRGSFAAVVGASGSGKSSLLQAGLLPALAGGALPGSGRWRQVLIRPGRLPLAQLRSALDVAPEGAVEASLDALGEGERLLLAVDQLEEVFTACDSERERAGFLGALTGLATDPQGRAAVVATVRADFYGRFAVYPMLAALLGVNNVLVGPMHASQLRRAVELPAARAGLQVEPELVDALIDDVEGEPGALPLLSTALVELWQLRSGSTLTLAGYHSTGGVGGAVSRLAEETYAGIPETQQPLVRTIMLRLVGEGEDPSSAVGRRASLAEFDLHHDTDTRTVLAALSEARLVTVSEETVEVAHEALLREWPRLRDWIEEDAQARHLRGRITDSAAEWDAAGRDPGQLYRGARLAAVLDYTSNHPDELNAVERDFVGESRAAADTETGRIRRTNRRLRVLLAAAVVAGLFAYVQRNQAQESETVQLAHSLGAQALVEQDLDLSLLLARQAVALHDTPQTRRYLLAELLRHPAVIGTMQTNSEAMGTQTVAVSPDGTTLAIGFTGAGLFFFDARTFDPIGEPEKSIGSFGSLVYSPDGRTLAYSSGRSIGLLDASSHRVLESSSLQPAEALGIAFTPDGSKLMVIASDGQFSTWDAQTLTALTSVQPPTVGQASTTSTATGGWDVFTGDLRSLLTSSNGNLTLWDLESQQVVCTQHTDDVPQAMAISPDKGTVAVGIDDGIQLIDVATSSVRRAKGVPGAAPSDLLFSPDGSTLVMTGADGSLTLWSTDTLTQTAVLRGRGPSVCPAVFSPDGRTLYTGGPDGATIAWDISGTRGVSARVTFMDGTDPEKGPSMGRFSPDGGLIAAALPSEGIRLIDADGLTPSGDPLRPTGGQVQSLAFSRDGRLLAAIGLLAPIRGSLQVDGHDQPAIDPPEPPPWALTVWDIDARSLLIGPLSILVESVGGIDFSPDGKTIAVGNDRGVQLFDVASGAELDRLGDGAANVAFSPSAPVLAFVAEPYPGYPAHIEMWDIDRRTRIVSLNPITRIVGIEFSPDGRLFSAVYPGPDPVVRIWDAHNWQSLREIRPDASDIASLTFSPDGTVLALADGEGYVELWDVASGSEMGVTFEVGGGQPILDFSTDGRRLLATMDNGTGAVLDVDPQSWADRVCTVANRTLTEQEWEMYLPGRPYEPACAE